MRTICITRVHSLKLTECSRNLILRRVVSWEPRTRGFLRALRSLIPLQTKFGTACARSMEFFSGPELDEQHKYIVSERNQAIARVSSRLWRNSSTRSDCSLWLSTFSMIAHCSTKMCSRRQCVEARLWAPGSSCGDRARAVPHRSRYHARRRLNDVANGVPQ